MSTAPINDIAQFLGRNLEHLVFLQILGEDVDDGFEHSEDDGVLQLYTDDHGEGLVYDLCVFTALEIKELRSMVTTHNRLVHSRRERAAIQTEGTLRDGTPLEGQLAFIVVSACTDNAGLWMEYWIDALRADDPAIAQGPLAIATRLSEVGHGTPEQIVAICFDIDFALDTMHGQFCGRGSESATVPEHYQQHLPQPALL